MSDTLPIIPLNTAGLVRVRLPGSKSITNRALILAALTQQEVTLKGALFSRDTRIMVAALRKLGFEVCENEPQNEITITGRGGDIPVAEANLHIGNAGTAARFLTAFLALKEGGTYHMDGDEAMRKRPMAGLLDILVQAGAVEVEYHAEKGFFPFTLRTKGLPGGEYSVDASASSQILSALLMVQPFAREKARFEAPGVRPAYIEITRKVMADFGYTENSQGYALSSTEYQIEPDASAASYFLVLSLIRPDVQVLIEDFFPDRSIQGDTAFIKVLEQLNMRFTQTTDGLLCDASGFSACELNENFNHFSDTFLALAALSPVLGRKIRFEGLLHTRKQETDRVLGMARNLTELGQKVTPSVEELEQDESLGFLEIEPNRKAMERLAWEAIQQDRCLEMDTYEDHRFAMSFGILGLYDILGDGRPWLAIKDPSCCGKTFPAFFEVLDQCRAILSHKPVIVTIDGGAASGKSSTAKGVSRQLDFLHVDTGSHYRAVTYFLLQAGVNVDDVEAVKAALEKLEPGVEIEGRSAYITMNGQRPTGEEIRSPEVNEAVSKVAAIKEVRQFLFEYQQSLAQESVIHGFPGMVMEGRDIGSVIFPDSPFKFFLEADASTRTARRASQGQTDSIQQRDAMDQSRKTAPLVCPEGAIRIDNSNLNLEEVIAIVRKHIETACS